MYIIYVMTTILKATKCHTAHHALVRHLSDCNAVRLNEMRNNVCIVGNVNMMIYVDVQP